MAKKSVNHKKVLCKETCLAKNMGLGYCVAGRLYTVNAGVKISHHFEEIKTPKEEIEVKEDEGKEETTEPEGQVETEKPAGKKSPSGKTSKAGK